jgi:hypothetical protein
MTNQRRLAVVMDPIEHLKYAKDTTLAMMLAAQRRGYALTYLRLEDLSLRDGVAMGAGRPVQVHADPARYYTLGEPRVEPLGNFDAILMRKDPPFDTEYIYSTYILERAEAAGALVVNRPRGLRDMNEKVYTAWFPDCCAPTLITRSMADMAGFAAEHGRIVCKPLHGMGGRSIFVVEPGDKNMQVVFETLTDYGTRYPQPRGQRQPRQPRGRSDRRRTTAERPGPRTGGAHRARPARGGHAFCGAGRDRRLRHRDQRDQSHRRTGTRQAVRHRPGRLAAGRDRPSAGGSWPRLKQRPGWARCWCWPPSCISSSCWA